MALVLKKWTINENSIEDDNLIQISGRESGIISFLLSLIGVDPTTTFVLSKNKIIFARGSWEGYKKIVVPTHNISSCYFGYTKPWKLAIAIGFITMPFLFLGLILGPLYYFLNKQLEIGLVDNSGSTYPIAFKRSVIENIKIDEKEGSRILTLIEKTILESQNIK